MFITAHFHSRGPETGGNGVLQSTVTMSRSSVDLSYISFYCIGYINNSLGHFLCVTTGATYELHEMFGTVQGAKPKSRCRRHAHMILYVINAF
jgi:hypothetical protein